MTFYFFLAIILAFVGVVGDFFIKLAGLHKTMEIKWFSVGLIIYALTAFGWFFAIKHIKLSTLGVIYAVSTVLFLVIIGVFYFKESLNAYEILGVAIGVISIVLLGRFA